LIAGVLEFETGNTFGRWASAISSVVRVVAKLADTRPIDRDRCPPGCLHRSSQCNRWSDRHLTRTAVDSQLKMCALTF